MEDSSSVTQELVHNGLMRLAEFLRERLTEHGSQAKFARATKISDGTVSKWARGEMDRAPNFVNCIRIAVWARESPLTIFEMAERPDYAELFNELFPEYTHKPAQEAVSICPSNDPDHISYHRDLEKILHLAAEEKLKTGIIANIEAMRDKALPPSSGDAGTEGKHGPGSPLGPVLDTDKIVPKKRRRRKGFGD